jgi:hypothetical protein
VDLTLANDGRELASPSYLSYDVACGQSDGLEDEVQLDDLYQPRRAVQVAVDGRFAWRSRPELDSERKIAITGTFTRGGRAAVGSLLVREDPPCPSFRSAFRARLIGRPHTPHPGRPSICDRVTVRNDYRGTNGGDEAFRVYERDVGCTAARETARLWRTSRPCQRLTTGGMCSLPGAVCRAVRGGLFSALVSAQCSLTAHPGGLTEFVHYQPCPQPRVPQGDDLTMWAINLRCKTAAAFPIATLIDELERASGRCDGSVYGPGKPAHCAAIAGFVCQARSEDSYGLVGGWHAHCGRQRDSFGAIEIDDVFH